MLHGSRHYSFRIVCGGMKDERCKGAGKTWGKRWGHMDGVGTWMGRARKQEMASREIERRHRASWHKSRGYRWIIGRYIIC